MISTKEQFLDPLPIPDADLVYRQIPLMHLEKKTRFPKESHFAPDSDGLSVHWSYRSTPEYVYKIIGISYRPKSTNYKNPREFRVFCLPVLYLRSLDNLRVEHTPVFEGNPAPIGSPNNYAHASIVYSVEDVEIRIKLSDYCRENFEESHCPINFVLLDSIVEELRSRLDNTNYHRLPWNMEPDRMNTIEPNA